MTAVTMLGAAAFAPSVAEAQARGTLQATARVVDTRVGFEALQAARSLAQSWAARPGEHQHTVATVAQVNVAYRPATRVGERPEPSALVVTIDYLRN